MMATRTHPYHTISLSAPQDFIDEVDTVLREWISQCELSILHVTIDYPPSSDPIYRITVPGYDSDGDDAPIEFMLALVFDVAHRAERPEPNVGSSTTWHENELEPGTHATDVLTAELLKIGSYDFVFNVPRWYPLDLFEYVTTCVFEAQKVPDDTEFNPEWIWMPDSAAIQLTIYGRPAIDEAAFERALADALCETIAAPYVAGWLAESYEDDNDDLD